MEECSKQIGVLVAYFFWHIYCNFNIMTEQMIINIVREAFWNVLLTVGPVLLASLIVGLSISIFQAATSIQEQTLTFVPKLIVTFAIVVILLPFFINNLKAFTIQLFNMIPTLTNLY